jgi:hypothetical protein
MELVRVAGGLCASKGQLKPTKGFMFDSKSYLKKDEKIRNVDRAVYPGWRFNAVLVGYEYNCGWEVGG